MELLGRFASGDFEAFEALFRQLQGEVYGWIVRIVRDPAVAEDLTVETFWRICRAHARFDPTRSPVPWARRIATHVALDHLRRSKPEPELPAQIPGPIAPDPVLAREWWC
jgi:RNA polymerase sigma-70 factor, ECF subfamily